MQKLGDVFNVVFPKTSTLIEQKIVVDGIPFVSSRGKNNGVSFRVAINKELTLFPKGSLTVPMKGSVLYAFLQPERFYCAHQIAVLVPKKTMTDTEKLIIKENRYRFSCGRQADKTLEDLQVPAIEDVRRLVPAIKINPPSKKPYHDKNVSLSDREWGAFVYEDIFDIKKGFYNKKPNMNEIGEVPFIGATEKNNGVTFLYPVETISETCRDGGKENTENMKGKMYLKGCVTFSNGGSIGNAFYQSLDFTCAHHINPIYIKGRRMTPFVGLFLSALMELDKYRYSAFGRECRLSRLPKSTIKLPVAKNGGGVVRPDWDFMEYYIKSLPYSSNL